MPWKINPKAEEMHAAYCSGLSLAEVASRYGQTRQSVYGIFKYRGWPTRQRRKPLPSVSFNGATYAMRNNGYLGKTSGTRTLLHRDVWAFHRGSIPAGWDIHHIDGNKTNNDISNLECLPKPEHTRRYSPHNNQYTRGRKR